MISVTFAAAVVVRGDRNVASPVMVTFTYDPEYNPLAIQAIFSVAGEEDVVWVFGRDLLNRGVNSYVKVGNGDVRFRHEGGESLLMCLSNPESHVDIRLPHSPVVAFLNSLKEVDETGAGLIEQRVDELIEEIFSGE